MQPVIFTTAFHEYALDAFRYFAIDYLVKPVMFSALQGVLYKLRNIVQPAARNYHDLITGYDTFSNEPYKERFLVRIGQKFVFVRASDIDFFKAEEKLVFIVERKGNKFSIDYTLEKLEAPS